MTVPDLAQPIVDSVIIRRQFQRLTHQLHRQPGAAERTCDKRQRRLSAPVAREQIGEDAAGADGLLAAEIVERSILRALQPAFRVPFGFAVANVVDCRRRHRTLGYSLLNELLSEMSGASGRFMPTT